MIFVVIIDELGGFSDDSFASKMSEIKEGKEYSIHVNDHVLHVLCTGDAKSISVTSKQNYVRLSEPFESSEIAITKLPCYFIIYHLSQGEGKEFTIDGKKPTVTNTLNESFIQEWGYLSDFPGFAVFDSRSEPITKVLQFFELIYNIDQLHKRWVGSLND